MESAGGLAGREYCLNIIISNYIGGQLKGTARCNTNVVGDWSSGMILA